MRILLLAALLATLPAQAVTLLERAKVSVTRSDSIMPAKAETITLPYHWDRLQGAADGTASFLLTFQIDDPTQPQALYIPRIGNTFEIKVNGSVISRMGIPGDPYQDFAKQAHYVVIPKEIARNINQLEVTIHVVRGRNGGLSPIWVGSLTEIYALYEPTHRLQETGTRVVIVVSMVLGALSLLLWVRQRDRLYLYYGAGEFLWALSMSDAVLDNVPLPWPWWGVVFFSATVISAILIFKFALIVAELHHGIWKKLTNWQLALNVPVVLIGLLAGLPWMEQVWKSLTDILLISIIITIVRHCVRSKDLEKRGLAYAMIILGIVGTRDEIVLILLPYVFHPTQQNDPYANFLWMRYAWVFFGMSMSWIIAERMRKASLEIANMNQTLTTRLAQREAELNLLFASQTEEDRNRAVQEERQRLMRDMHDGLGSQLVAALQLAHNPEVSREVVSAQLRETLDQLKLTVDAMQETEGDIPSLLGALRYRLTPRIDMVGIELTWSVETLPTIENWNLPQSRDLQMILYEAFSNLLVHSHATRASLQAWQTSDGKIHIVLRDNGCGFDVTTLTEGRGKGLHNMEVRATRIAAHCAINSTAEGTEVRLTLEVYKKTPGTLVG
jgi:signal transduction histidine kinase